jgi:Undecaprenyl-phosphate galactose phosphotransferase WbaP
MASLGVPRLGDLRDIVGVSRSLGVRILIACQDERLFRRQLDDLAGWFTHVEYMPSVRAFPVYGARAVSFGGIGGLELMNEGRMVAKRVQKRVLDAVSALAAFVVFLPAFIVIPILVKLTSRGPVFYRHRRLGRGGREIWIWKFRSMYADADERLKSMLAGDPAAAREWERSFKLAKDPRVTPFGRFLRKTSLDELPQLFNVFAGEMALIGPRPIVEKEIPYYGDAYKVFSSVRPGITGLWQVSGRSDTGYERRVALDTYYVLNWSPWMDLWILVRSVYAVLFMRGAY